MKVDLQVDMQVFTKNKTTMRELKSKRWKETHPSIGTWSGAFFKFANAYFDWLPCDDVFKLGDAPPVNELECCQFLHKNVYECFWLHTMTVVTSTLEVLDFYINTLKTWESQELLPRILLQTSSHLSQSRSRITLSSTNTLLIKTLRSQVVIMNVSSMWEASYFYFTTIHGFQKFSTSIGMPFPHILLMSWRIVILILSHLLHNSVSLERVARKKRWASIKTQKDMRLLQHDWKLEMSAARFLKKRQIWNLIGTPFNLSTHLQNAWKETMKIWKCTSHVAGNETSSRVWFRCQWISGGKVFLEIYHICIINPFPSSFSHSFLSVTTHLLANTDNSTFYHHLEKLCNNNTKSPLGCLVYGLHLSVNIIGFLGKLISLGFLIMKVVPAHLYLKYCHIPWTMLEGQVLWVMRSLWCSYS